MANNITPNPSVPSQIVAEAKFPKFINNLGIIPTSYKDSMSYYECLAWLCKYLEETVIPTVNQNGEAVEELQNLYNELNSYVTHYFETLDVQEEVNTKLDELVEDGTLAELIDNYFTEVENNKLYGMKINSHRLYRQLNEVGKASLYKDVDLTTNYYHVGQGFTMVDDTTAIIGKIEGSTNYTNNNAKVQVINITTGNIIKEVVGNFGHINDISYNPDDNLIYIGGCSTYDNQGTLTESNRLIILNYNNLQIVNEIELPNVIAGVSYDRSTGKLYVNYHTQVYEINQETFTISSTITLQNIQSFESGGQTVKVFNNKIYKVETYPNVIQMFDISGNHINNFILNEYMDNTFFIGELEGIELINNKLYFASYSGEYPFCPVDMIQIGYTSLNKNIPNQDNRTMNHFNDILQITVDNTSTAINPNGGSTAPFKELVEAVNVITSPAYQYFDCTITLANTGNEYYGCQIHGNGIKNLYLNNQTVGYLRFENITTYLSRGFFKGTITNRPNVEINNSNITFYRPNAIDNNTGSTYAIQINESNVFIPYYTVDDSFDDMFINVIGSSELKTNRNLLNNIHKASDIPVVDKFLIYSGTINATATNYNYSSSVPNILSDQYYKYKYINVVLHKQNGYEVHKLKTSEATVRINSVYTNFGDTSYIIFVLQYALTLSDNYITTANAKKITKDINGTAGSIETSNISDTITEIYLSDN